MGHVTLTTPIKAWSGSAYSWQALKIYVNNGSGHHQPRLEFFALCTKSQPYLFFSL